MGRWQPHEDLATPCRVERHRQPSARVSRARCAGARNIGSSILLAATQNRPLGKRKVKKQYEVKEGNEHPQAEPPGVACLLEGLPPRPNEDDKQNYQRLYAQVAAELTRRQIKSPITFGSLWDWHGRWSSGDLPSYQSRREFVSELIAPLINRIRTGRAEADPLTGWTRVDRCVGELRDRLAAAPSEEQFQAVGLLGREALISVAQAVYDRARHPALDDTEPSITDGNRMLEAYIAAELGGNAHEAARKHARSALEFAVALQHRRTATFRDAALCAEATTAVINVIAIVAGRRDPQL